MSHCIEKLTHLFPGFALSVFLAAIAIGAGKYIGGPVMLYALILGIAGNRVGTATRYAPGITFSAKKILRIGVALLGVRITISDVSSLGLQTAALVMVGVASTLVIGSYIGRALGLKSDHATLSAGAVAICGASAALAISAVLPQSKTNERNTILTVIGVTTVSTIVMVLYPIIAKALSFTDVQAGVFFGAAIHDVAQVVGAGFIVSDQAAEVATITKLMRVACLVPAICIISMLFRKECAETAKGKHPPILPMFLVGFIALMLATSAGVFSEPMVSSLTIASKWALVVSVTALGLKTSLTDLTTMGAKPVAALLLQTGFLCVLVLAALMTVLVY